MLVNKMTEALAPQEGSLECVRTSDKQRTLGAAYRTPWHPSFNSSGASKLAVYIALLLLVGCGPKSPPLPTYQLTDDATAIRTIAERSHAIHSVQATCGLTLTRPDKQSVALDGILIVVPPDRLRLQASKFGQKLFDLTLNPDGLFIKVDDPSRKDKAVPASLSAARFVKEWSLFNGGFFDAPDINTQSSNSSTLVLFRKLVDGRKVVCEIDRPTLTPQLYRMFDPDGVQRFTLAIPAYRLVNGIVYPDAMTADSEQGKIEIQMRDVDLNSEVAEGAFVPPAHAEKQP